MIDESNDLPPTPPQLLDLLRRLESRLGELDAVRDEVRAVRLALESKQTEDAVASVGRIHHASGTVEMVSSTSGSAQVIPHGSGHGLTVWHGEAHGEAPPVIVDGPTGEWLSALRRRGGQAARAADVMSRIVYLAAKLGEPFL